MKKIKRLIILFFVVFIIINIISFFIKKDVILLGNYTKVKVKGNNIEIYYSNAEEYYTKAKTFINDEIIDCYIRTSKFENNNHYIMTNNNGQVLSYNTSIPITIIGDSEIEIKEIDSSILHNAEDLEDLERIKNKNNIKGELSFYKKVMLSNDMIVSNALIIGENSKIYSLIYTKYNDELYLVNKIESDYESPKEEKEIIKYLIDFNDDGEFELVSSHSTGDDSPNYANIYKLEDNKYIKIK